MSDGGLRASSTKPRMKALVFSVRQINFQPTQLPPRCSGASSLSMLHRFSEYGSPLRCLSSRCQPLLRSLFRIIAWEANLRQDDLQQFHARTVRSSASPPSEYGNQAHSMGAGLEDDGLGYYPDGCKRTLSDEQVAIFRHTEIQSLLRARRLEQENQESDGSERPPTKKPGM